MTPKRPYLLRAFYDWIVDNHLTPHILVNAEAEAVNVPRQHIKDGKIVLNISPMAVQDFMMDDEALSFSARFGGVSFYIYCPMYAIEALYAREAPVEGVSFSDSEYQQQDEARDGEVKPGGAEKPKLAAVSAIDERTDAAVDVTDESAAEDDDNPPPRKRPSLRVIK
ncbi:MAG: ClpXP protease specificity-enhancing factor [Thiothrix nivea]|nr:MAG: ClpXP protease specificity-enhancing factor [Thiothrix nivea]